MARIVGVGITLKFITIPKILSRERQPLLGRFGVLLILVVLGSTIQILRLADLLLKAVVLNGYSNCFYRVLADSSMLRGSSIQHLAP
jgi:hypothetical protein